MTTLRLTAPLLDHARAFTASDGGAWMELRLQMESGTATAMVRMGKGPAAQHVTAAAARRYRRGEVVTVYATGWTVDYSTGDLLLAGINHVELPPVGIDRLTPEHEETSA